MPKALVAVVACALLGGGAAIAQPMDSPDQAARKVSPYVYMRDGAGNKAFIETTFWRNDPNYDAKTLHRFSDVMAGLEKMGFKSSPEAANGWDKPEKVVRCRITLEATNKRWKGKTGAVIGCDNSPISETEVVGSETPTHLKQVLDDFTKQFNLTKEKLAR